MAEPTYYSNQTWPGIPSDVVRSTVSQEQADLIALQLHAARPDPRTPAPAVNYDEQLP